MGMTVSRNLRKPDLTVAGWLMGRQLVKMNAGTERLAAQMCEIKPHHNVLEVGFGPGIGLKTAFPYIKDGPGDLHGIDLSERMVKLAKSNLREEISSGKLELRLGSVTDLPYPADTFDQIFHTNCFYFWDNMDMAVKELNRVIKADGNMLCLMDIALLEKVVKKRYMQCGNTDPNRYMDSLRKNEFQDVYMANIPPGTLHAIYATAKK